MSERARAAWVAVGLFVVWIVYGRLSPGTFNDDDIVHFFLARHSFERPELFLSLWGRPLHTILYAIPSRLGYEAVEALTAALTAASVYLTWFAARRLGLRSRAVAVAAAALQPFVFKMGYSGLVEPLGAFLLVGALAFVLTRHFAWAALAIGLLPLSRFELVIVVPFLLWPVFRAVGVRGLAIAALPLLAWNGAGWWMESDPLWLWNELTGGHFTRSFEGARSLMHYTWSLPMVTGGVLFPLVVLGLGWPPRSDHGVSLRWMFLSLLALHSFLAWDVHEFGGSVGYLRHLVAAGPVIALLAGSGLDRWRAVVESSESPLRSRTFLVASLATGGVIAMAAFNVHHFVWEHPVNRFVEPWIWPLGAGLALATLAAWSTGRMRVDLRWLIIGGAAVTTLAAEPPIRLDEERAAMRDAEQWIRTYMPGRRIAVNHPWFFFLGRRDQFDRVQYPNLDHETLRALPAGSLVLWEDHYSPRLSGDVDLTYFAEHPGRFLPRHKGFVSEYFKFVLFEVIEPAEGS